MRPCHHWGLSCVGLSARGSHVDGRLRPGAGTGPAGSGCPPPTCAVMRSCRPHPWACWGHRNQLWGGAGLRAAVTGSDSVPWGKLLLTGAALGAGSHVQSPRPSEDLAGADVPSAHECEDTGLVTSVRWPSVLGPAVWGGVLGGRGRGLPSAFQSRSGRAAGGAGGTAAASTGLWAPRTVSVGSSGLWAPRTVGVGSAGLVGKQADRGASEAQVTPTQDPDWGPDASSCREESG